MKPFDLEKALAGEPVRLRNGDKAYIKYKLEPNQIRHKEDEARVLHGFIVDDNDKFVLNGSWAINGSYRLIKGVESDEDIIGMYEEPRSTVTLTLPCPLKEPQPNMWFITSTFTVTQSCYSENSTKELTVSSEILEKGLYFNTEEDAQAWIDAFKNNRK